MDVAAFFPRLEGFIKVSSIIILEKRKKKKKRETSLTTLPRPLASFFCVVTILYYRERFFEQGRVTLKRKFDEIRNVSRILNLIIIKVRKV